ncbi:histone-lysine N-methyltransferase [Acrasis kona]|uniref:Histone-lysine N-methyltransferase n=1 Tax=Acrasis kona TaxID=1008807 RepID=A0AAW2YXY5_9EUKA
MDEDYLDDNQEVNVVYESDESESDSELVYTPRKKRRLSSSPIKDYTTDDKDVNKDAKPSTSSCPLVTSSTQIPEDIGNVDKSQFVVWKNQLYALSRAFPDKGRVQQLKDKYEQQFKKTACLVIDSGDLRKLKQNNPNVSGHARQVSLFSMYFVSYYVETENVNNV